MTTFKLNLSIAIPPLGLWIAMTNLKDLIRKSIFFIFSFFMLCTCAFAQPAAVIPAFPERPQERPTLMMPKPLSDNDRRILLWITEPRQLFAMSESAAFNHLRTITDFSNPPFLNYISPDVLAEALINGIQFILDGQTLEDHYPTNPYLLQEIASNLQIPKQVKQAALFLKGAHIPRFFFRDLFIEMKNIQTLHLDVQGAHLPDFSRRSEPLNRLEIVTLIGTLKHLRNLRIDLRGATLPSDFLNNFLKFKKLTWLQLWADILYEEESLQATLISFWKHYPKAALHLSLTLLTNPDQTFLQFPEIYPEQSHHTLHLSQRILSNTTATHYFHPLGTLIRTFLENASELMNKKMHAVRRPSVETLLEILEQTDSSEVQIIFRNIIHISDVYFLLEDGPIKRLLGVQIKEFLNYLHFAEQQWDTTTISPNDMIHDPAAIVTFLKALQEEPFDLRLSDLSEQSGLSERHRTHLIKTYFEKPLRALVKKVKKISGYSQEECHIRSIVFDAEEKFKRIQGKKSFYSPQELTTTEINTVRKEVDDFLNT